MRLIYLPKGAVVRKALCIFGITLAAAAGADEYWTLPIPPQGTAPADYVEPAKDLSPAACGVCHRKQFRE